MRAADHQNRLLFFDFKYRYYLDDYILKPFSPSEVMARIRAVLRRVDRTSEAEN